MHIYTCLNSILVNLLVNIACYCELTLERLTQCFAVACRQMTSVDPTP